jgi:hypothetical protein
VVVPHPLLDPGEPPDPRGRAVGPDHEAGAEAAAIGEAELRPLFTEGDGLELGRPEGRDGREVPVDGRHRRLDEARGHDMA